MDYTELWMKVVCNGDLVDSASGFGAEADWFFGEYECVVDGEEYRAAEYVTEARNVKDLYVYSTSADEWTNIWSNESRY